MIMDGFSNLHIFDCTLRDGGYYNDWDFEDTIIDSYIEAMNVLPVDYLEIGYRTPPPPRKKVVLNQ